MERLLAGHRPGRATAAAYRGADGVLRGHPVLFERAGALSAAMAQGDRSARDWLAWNADRIDVIDCTDLGEGRDVDVPEELPRLGPRIRPGSARSR